MYAMHLANFRDTGLALNAENKVPRDKTEISDLFRLLRQLRKISASPRR